MRHTDNLLLASLSQSDIALLLPHLKLMHVKQHQLLFEPGENILTTYFPTTAIVSLVVLLSGGHSVEAAMVGRDGVVSATAALDGKIAVNRGVIQLAGDLLACDSNALKAAGRWTEPTPRAPESAAAPSVGASEPASPASQPAGPGG